MVVRLPLARPPSAESEVGDDAQSSSSESGTALVRTKLQDVGALAERIQTDLHTVEEYDQLAALLTKQRHRLAHAARAGSVASSAATIKHGVDVMRAIGMCVPPRRRSEQAKHRALLRRV